MVREAVKMLSFTFVFVVLHVLVHIGLICFSVAAIADDFSVRDTACDHSFHLFKYCGFNGAGFFISLLTYFILKTGEPARARAAALGIMHSGCGAWGVSTWGALVDTDCETVFSDQYLTMWLCWNSLVAANCFYGILYMLHELVWSRYQNIDLTVVCEAQSAEAAKAQATRAGTLPSTYNYTKGGVPSPAGKKGSTVGTPAAAPIPPELQAEYQKVVAGVPPFISGIDSQH